LHLAALASVFVVLTLSLLINRIATVVLTLTGLSRESARFQARSALTGVGFTPRESEQIVRHRVRRETISVLMLLGNVGIVTTISSLLLTFLMSGPRQWIVRLLILGVGLFLLWRGATSQWIDRHLSRAIESALRRCTRLEVRDYVRLLNLSGEYTVTQLRVQPQDWLANDDLQGLNLTREGVTVLGIHRSNGRYVGAPQSDTRIYPGDTLVLYGRLPVLAELDDRCADLAGEASHHRAIAEQERRVKQQDCQEKQENF
jgi:hypothetical protein